MAYSLMRHIPPLEREEYYDSGFRVMLEDYLLVIREKSNKSLSPTPQEQVKYRGDLAGLLVAHGVPTYLHWITLRINEFTHTSDYNGESIILLLPDASLIKDLMVTFLTKRKRF